MHQAHKSLKVYIPYFKPQFAERKILFEKEFGDPNEA
jgi:hypothetical protein